MVKKFAVKSERNSTCSGSSSQYKPTSIRFLKKIDPPISTILSKKRPPSFNSLIGD